MSQIIEILKEKLLPKQDLVEDFLREKFKKNPPTFYNSVDLRHSGFKIAPIDTNCFPAGFNNVQKTSKEHAKIIAKNSIKEKFGDVKKILIIPENHTRNLKYLENLLSIKEIIQTSENEVIFGSMIPDLEDKITIDLENNQKITLEKIVKNDDKISTKSGFIPELIILNNDLTGGTPEILQNINIPITPSTEFGWYQRSKSNHFSIYNKLAAELSEILEIDPWLISSYHEICEEVDFKKNIGFNCLAREVDFLLKKLNEKYQEYNINETPYCYIKADNGTYGMAVMQVHSGEEALNLNKKERNKMNMLKESRQNTVALIQEGIPSIDKVKNKTAEPLIYMINGQIIANLFRAHESRDYKKSLNAAGAEFFDLRNIEDNELMLGCKKDNMTIIYSLIGRLAALSSSMELEKNI